jgi:hypothetical protein
LEIHINANICTAGSIPLVVLEGRRRLTRLVRRWKVLRLHNCALDVLFYSAPQNADVLNGAKQDLRMIQAELARRLTSGELLKKSALRGQ